MPTSAEKNISEFDSSTADGYLVGHADGVTKLFDTRDFSRNRSVIKTITGNYTLIDSDEGKVLIHTDSSGCTITIPDDLTLTAWPVGGVLNVMRNGSGVLTFAAGSGATLKTAGRAKARVSGSMVQLMKTAANTWVMWGDTTA
jgi:hypothetical protein